MAKIDVICPRCCETSGVILNSAVEIQLYRCKHGLKTFQLKNMDITIESSREYSYK